MAPARQGGPGSPKIAQVRRRQRRDRDELRSTYQQSFWYVSAASGPGGTTSTPVRATPESRGTDGTRGEDMPFAAPRKDRSAAPAVPILGHRAEALCNREARASNSDR